MANAKNSANPRNMIQGGKNSLLPPKSPFPVIPSPYTDSTLNQSIGPKTIPMLNEGNAYHRRTSSESFLAEEQPSWLDDLLDEPETPVKRGHRRSSSDSFAYLDMGSMSNVGHLPQLTDERKYDMGLAQLWGSQNIRPYQGFQQGSFSIDLNKYANLRNKSWEFPLSSGSRCGGTSLRDNNISQGAESSSVPWEGDQASYIAAENQDDSRFSAYETKAFHEKKDGSHGYVASENDTKRAKQQFAQRSRVRKLQYIAELERNVQGLQAEGSEVSAELEFVTQQNLILSMENKALKQRLESLAQEHLIKRLEHEVLEREIGRLRALYQQQQSQQPPQQPLHRQRQSSSTHRRSNSKDLDAQFASLSMRHKEAGPGTDPVTGSIHI